MRKSEDRGDNMISNMHYLGIYEDAIDNAVESSENLLKLFNFNDNDINLLNYYAREYLIENGNFNEITNSIIYAYFITAKEYVESKYPNAVVTFYVNYHDSYLYLDGVEV